MRVRNYKRAVRGRNRRGYAEESVPVVLYSEEDDEWYEFNPVQMVLKGDPGEWGVKSFKTSYNRGKLRRGEREAGFEYVIKLSNGDVVKGISQNDFSPKGMI